MMQIYRATETKGRSADRIYAQVRDFYYDLIDALGERVRYPHWEKDAHPSPAELKTAIANGELFVCEEDERIASCMVVNDHGDLYDQGKWTTELSEGEYLVIHILGVHPDFMEKGYAKEMVRYAIDRAKKEGKKAIRLDVLQGNLPAERLYAGLGFEQTDTIEIYYESTGWAKFELYEYVI